MAAASASGSASRPASRVVLFLGPPGVGKGTQARFFAGRWGIPHVATGDMLRDAAARQTPMGLEAKTRYMDKGKLVPDEVVQKIVEERLREADARPGVLLDGFPRNEAQAAFLDRVLERQGREVSLVIYLEADEEVIVGRVAGRRMCGGCQATYHMQNNPSAKPGVCDRCGKELVWRDDDRPEAVRQRLSDYEAETQPLVRHYEDRGVLWRIDGSGDVEEIRTAIIGAETAVSGAVNG